MMRMAAGWLGLVLLASSPALAAPARCTRVVAAEVPNRELTFVGLVAHAGKRAALVMDRAHHGHVVRTGECLGRDRASFEHVVRGSVDDGVPPRTFKPA